MSPKGLALLVGVAALIVALVLWASFAAAQCVKETSGTHWFPGRVRTGPTTCANLNTGDQCNRQPGTWVWCADCQPTCPATCGGPGAHCFHDATQWNCSNAQGTCVTATTTTTLNPCTPDPCVNGGICMMAGGGGFFCLCPCGFCGDQCETFCGATTTTSAPSTTSTSTSSTTTISGASTTSAPTSTTTSSTTTTTLAEGLSVTFLWVPSFPQVDSQEQWGTANELRCNLYVPEVGIDDATSISFGANAGSQTCGVAIYSEDGTSRITTTGGIAGCGGGSANTVTSSAFDLLPGTAYQVCSCSTGSGFYATAHAGSSSQLNALQNALSGRPLNTIAATACSSGVPPLTTGALSADATSHAPILLLLGTNTP